jgi:hypothetical protein
MNYADEQGFTAYQDRLEQLSKHHGMVFVPDDGWDKLAMG